MKPPASMIVILSARFCDCGSGSGQLIGCGYPAAAHRFVNIDKRKEKLALRLRVLQLRVEKLGFRVSDFEIARVAVLVAQPRLPGVAGQRCDLSGLRRKLLSRLRLIDQRVVYFLERSLDGLLLGQERLLLLRFGNGELAGQRAAREDRLRNDAAIGPGLSRSFEEAGK